MTRRQKAEIAATAICIAIVGATCSMAQLPFGLDPLGTLGWTPKRLNPVAWYKAEDNALDSSGNGYHGTWSGTAAYVDGKVGRAFSMDGTNYIEISSAANATLPSGNADRTMAAWVFCNTDTGHVFHYGNNAPGQSIGIYVRSGLLSSHVWGSAATAIGNVPLAQWVHLCVVVRGANNVESWIDGTYAGSVTLAVNTVNTLTPKIGTRVDPSIQFDGEIDDVIIWPRALSADEIKDLYNRSLQREGAPWRTLE